MSWRFYVLIGVGGFLTALLAASFQRTAGYMDAEYYYISGRQIATGKGLTDEIIWNYLGDPAGIPAPSHAYWMPLVSFLASLGLLKNPSAGYLAARLPFLLTAAVIPPLTALLAIRLYLKPDLARLAGTIAVFPAFYLPFLPVTDCFGPLMVLGGLYFLLLVSKQPHEIWKSNRAELTFLGLGFLSGLMHLARADGLIWLGVTFLVVFVSWRYAASDKRIGRLVFSTLISASGYLVVMLPWFIRNQVVFGAPFAPGGSRALWLNEYNELFIYPASQLNFQHLIQSGIQSILKARLWSAGQNLQTALAVQGVIFLTPLIIMGLWRLRYAFPVRIAAIAWCLLFLAVTFLFPFQSARGGFFHSGAAFQPLFWAAAPLGLELLIDWGKSKRGWDPRKARMVFGVGLVGLALLITILVSYKHLFEPETGKFEWDAVEQRLRAVEDYLIEKGTDRHEIVMVNNPPGYYAVAFRPAISIPFGDLENICLVAKRYHARFLLLEIDQIKSGSELFSQPGDQLCLQYLDTVAGVRIFRIGDP